MIVRTRVGPIDNPAEMPQTRPQVLKFLEQKMKLHTIFSTRREAQRYWQREDG